MWNSFFLPKSGKMGFSIPKTPPKIVNIWKSYSSTKTTVSDLVYQFILTYFILYTYLQVKIHNWKRNCDYKYVNIFLILFLAKQSKKNRSLVYNVSIYVYLIYPLLRLYSIYRLYYNKFCCLQIPHKKIDRALKAEKLK